MRVDISVFLTLNAQIFSPPFTEIRFSGTVKVIGGDGKVIDTAGPGSFFGELALVYDVPRQANVVTVDTCQLAVLSKINFNVFKSEFVSLSQLTSTKRNPFVSLRVACKQIQISRYHQCYQGDC